MIPIPDRRFVERRDISRIQGIALEQIPDVRVGGHLMAIVLTRGGWHHLYFLTERPDWSDDEYFDHADRLLAEQGIREP